MIKNKNIIIFSSDDWNSGLKTSKYHIALKLSKYNKVLFINSIGLRKPTLQKNDLSRIISKLRRFLMGLERINDNLFVFTPIVIPFHENCLVNKLNQVVLIISLKVLQVRLQLWKPILLIFSLNFNCLIGNLGESEVVYYCIDELKGYREIDRVALENKEIELLRKSHCVIACSQTLFDSKKARHPNAYYVPHGVEWALFSKALLDKTEVPEDLSIIDKPILGFYGFISDDWIDFELIRFIAVQRPQWAVVLIGKIKGDINMLQGISNIHFLGQKAFEDLPRYSKGFDVAIIPFCLNELTLNSNPLKLFEYLSSGRPVVSVNIPEVNHYSQLVSIADTHEAFLKHIEEAMVSDNKALQMSRSEAMKCESWDDRIDKISGIIEKHLV